MFIEVCLTRKKCRNFRGSSVITIVLIKNFNISEENMYNGIISIPEKRLHYTLFSL